MNVESIGSAMGNEVKVLKSTALTGRLMGLGIGVALMGAAIVLGLDWSEDSWTALMCAAGIFIVFGSLLGLPGALRVRKTRITVYDQGFAYSDGKTQAGLRWSDIAGVVKQFVHGRKGRVILRSVTVQGRDGTRIVLNPNNISKGPVLAEYIQQKSLDYLLPTFLSAYENGQTVNFGPLQVSKMGLAMGDKSLPWDQVQTVNLRGWYVGINEGVLKSWASIELSQLPNPNLLLALIGRVGGAGVKVTQPQPVQL